MNQSLKKELISILESDQWMMDIMNIVMTLELNDSWIGAGFVRNKIWDEKHSRSRSKLNDIDVIYYNTSDTSKEADQQIENHLKEIAPEVQWSVKNQARMHLRNGHTQYKNCYEAISYWPETATAIAVKLDVYKKIEYIAPYGLSDLFNLIVAPSPNSNLKDYKNRVQQKNWNKTWPKLSIHNL